MKYLSSPPVLYFTNVITIRNPHSKGLFGDSQHYYSKKEHCIFRSFSHGEEEIGIYIDEI